jgi:hypothetical protein
MMGKEARRGQSGPPGPIGIRRPSPETSTRGRHFEGTPGGVERVSSEEYFLAASSLVRWSGSAALLGGLSTVFVDEVMLFHQGKSEGE